MSRPLLLNTTTFCNARCHFCIVLDKLNQPDFNMKDEEIYADPLGDRSRLVVRQAVLVSAQQVADGAVGEADVGGQLADRDWRAGAGALHQGAHQLGVYQLIPVFRGIQRPPRVT